MNVPLRDPDLSKFESLEAVYVISKNFVIPASILRRKFLNL